MIDEQVDRLEADFGRLLEEADLAGVTGARLTVTGLDSAGEPAAFSWAFAFNYRVRADWFPSKEAAWQHVRQNFLIVVGGGVKTWTRFLRAHGYVTDPRTGLMVWPDRMELEITRD